jgi:hypothetical protein
MYRTVAVGGGHAWRWTVYGIATYDKPPAGLEQTREKAMAAGCDDYDTKPIELPRLLDKITRLSGKSPQRSE